MTLEAAAEAVTGLRLTFFYNTRLYRVWEPVLPVGMLVPGLATTLTTALSWLAPEKGLADDLKIFLNKEGRLEPVITAVVSMPVSEQPFLD